MPLASAVIPDEDGIIISRVFGGEVELETRHPFGGEIAEQQHRPGW
jgi:hypothetical protein